MLGGEPGQNGYNRTHFCPSLHTGRQKSRSTRLSDTSQGPKHTHPVSRRSSRRYWRENRLKWHR